MARLLILLLGLGLAMAPARAQSLQSLLNGKVKAKNVVIPLYVSSETSPVALVRVGGVATEYQRRGFFCIGVLPVVVLDGVTIELRRPQSPGPALVQFKRHLQSVGARKVVELRRLALVLPGPAAARLTAERGRLSSAGAWELSNVAWRPEGQAGEDFAQAQLETEPGAPVILRAAGGSRRVVFADSQ